MALFQKLHHQEAVCFINGVIVISHDIVIFAIVITFLVVIAIIFLVLSMCSYKPDAQAISAADYGKPMTATEMQKGADEILAQVLKDPDSRRVEWGRSGKAWIWNGLFGGGPMYGYGLEALVNAKNGLGGYSGNKPYFFFFRDGSFIGADEVNVEGRYEFTP